MLADRFDLPVSTASAEARDAYVQGFELALTLYPGALQAFDRALAADPDLALAHAGKAQVLMREGKGAAARVEIAAAKRGRVTAREAGHIRVFDLAFSGQTQAAIEALDEHLAQWPRDALMVATAANPNGLIGGSGRLGQKRRILALLEALAPHYGDDYWFLSYHAIALAENGQHAAARDRVERSLGLNSKNAHVAHAMAHVGYESGDAADARAFLSTWLLDYPRDGAFRGHLCWHLALFELAAGEWECAQRWYRDGVELDRHSGGPPQRMTDGTAFLWRAELAGHPRDVEAWRKLYAFGIEALPQPGPSLPDLHVILTQAVMNDEAGCRARTCKMEELARSGRYLSGDFLPQIARGIFAFERRDYDEAIAALAPLVAQSERIGGSRAQHDLIEFTLLKAYLGAQRLDEARRLLHVRRSGPSSIPVAGLVSLQ